MRFNVAQLLKEPTGSIRAYTLDETSVLGEAEVALAVEGRVRLLRTDRGVWARATLRTSVLSCCSRCLGEFDLELRLRLDEQCYPAMDPRTGTPVPAASIEDDAVRIDAHQMLDLWDAFHQSVVAASPMKPLCRSDCRGICPQCGMNRNESRCECWEIHLDPRWLPLQGLMAEKASRS